MIQQNCSFRVELDFYSCCYNVNDSNYLFMILYITKNIQLDSKIIYY